MSNVVTSKSVASLRGKYLTVVLDNQGYGLAVQKVREIIRMPAITLVPQLPDFVKGVINLRGKVIPVIDLRLKFNLPAVVDQRTCVIVVQVSLPSGLTVQMGLVVDGVEEVVTLNEADLEPTPEFGIKVSTSYLIGMAKVKGQVKTLLNVDHIVSPETVEHIVQATNTPFSTLTQISPEA